MEVKYMEYGSNLDGFVLVISGLIFVLGLISVSQFVNLGSEITVTTTTLFAINKITT
jgi:hypothetical protein